MDYNIGSQIIIMLARCRKICRSQTSNRRCQHHLKALLTSQRHRSILTVETNIQKRYLINLNFLRKNRKLMNMKNRNSFFKQRRYIHQNLKIFKRRKLDALSTNLCHQFRHLSLQAISNHRY